MFTKRCREPIIRRDWLPYGRLQGPTTGPPQRAQGEPATSRQDQFPQGALQPHHGSKLGSEFSNNSKHKNQPKIWSEKENEPGDEAVFHLQQFPKESRKMTEKHWRISRNQTQKLLFSLFLFQPHYKPSGWWSANLNSCSADELVFSRLSYFLCCLSRVVLLT